MASAKLFLLCLFTVPFAQSGHLLSLRGGVNGGTACAACVLLVGLAEQLAEIHNETIADSTARLCSYLPKEFTAGCKALTEEYGPSLIALVETEETPDMVCYGLKFCLKDLEAQETCHLFPLPPSIQSPRDADLRIARAIQTALYARRGSPISMAAPKICSVPLIKPICDIIENFAGNHEPLVDADKDSFSDTYSYRGAYWRGKDCNDTDGEVYPGRTPASGDASFDANCNGIFGTDPSTGKTYEEQWCKDTESMGTVLLGDSAGAHFHLPPTWFTAKDINNETYSNLYTILTNEFDWPMLSFTTGYEESTKKWARDIQGPVDSIYLRMRALNRCNHRDYQNIGVNGERSSSVKGTVKSFARHVRLDKPAMVSLELLGNDVCSYHPDSSHMTTPDEYYNNMYETLQYLDGVLPAGSILILTGPVDGRILYDTLHNHIHPIGSTHQDVTYSAFYDFLNCLQISPCFGWMNSNETWRNITSERAYDLNIALQKLINNTSYRNFKAHYFLSPIKEVYDNWNGSKADLIEPVDGFHPSQLANARIANVSWTKLQQQGIIPSPNPFNDVIEKKFGEQGGH